MKLIQDQDTIYSNAFDGRINIEQFNPPEWFSDPGPAGGVGIGY
jgi:hypothetical protein